MIRIENTQVFGWEAAIRGARNPMNSWEKSDSNFLDHISLKGGILKKVFRNILKKIFHKDDIQIAIGFAGDDKECGINVLDSFVIGPNDHKLLMNLSKGGTEEAKWRRMVHVQCDITAPLYWWKEFETYRIGTVSNSCSTMHKIHAKEFTLDDFSCEHLLDCDDPLESAFDIPLIGVEFTDLYDDPGRLIQTPMDILKHTIEMLNRARELFLKDKDKSDWWQMIQLLPTSYNQKRTIDLNYEVLAAQYRQRKDHKLDEWHQYCDWIKALPYSEFITTEE
ncbi:MAG: hypothetical protein IJ899_03120 [Blautia sp.]|nr:hypothetical protein [Blautia sp.]